LSKEARMTIVLDNRSDDVNDVDVRVVGNERIKEEILCTIEDNI
jgi:hypothetical protein